MAATMVAIDSEEKALIYILCNYCIRKNISIKTILKLLKSLDITIFSDTTPLSQYILDLGWNWNDKLKTWEHDWICESQKDTSTQLDEKLEALKLPYSLKDLENDIQVSPNDAATLLKNMACIQSKLNEIVKVLNK